MKGIKNFINKNVLIILVLYTTCSIFFIEIYYSIAITLFLLISCAVFVLSNKENKLLFSKNEIIVYYIMIFSILSVILINNCYAESINSYAAILMQITGTLLITHLFSMEVFIQRYVNIVMIFAAISLVCFGLYHIYPSIALLFPKTEAVNSLSYYNAVVHVFQASGAYDFLVPFYRNAGICWEPGAYQAILNLALWFFLSDSKLGSRKYDLAKVVLLVVTIGTTYSTTGYLVLALSLLVHLKKVTNLILKSRSITLIAVVGVAFGILAVTRKGVSTLTMFNKMAREFGDLNVLFERLSLGDLKLLFDSPVNMLGIGFKRYQLLNTQSANSITHTAVTLGMPFLLSLATMYGMFCRKMKHSFVLLLMLVMFFSTESFIWRPLFLCFAWYGVKNDKSNRNNTYCK